MKHKLGWIPQLPDHRDYKYTLIKKHVGKPLPKKVDLRPYCPPVYDQGQIGSCTGNSIAAALEFTMSKEKQTTFTPSRLFIYYNERALEGTIPVDAGATIRDGITSVATQGDCPETEWPYIATPADPNTNAFPPNSAPVTKPTPQCYADAIQHKALTYWAVNQDMAEFRACLADGYPIVFGFTVYSSFEDNAVAANGYVPMPNQNDSVLGGHCVMAVGYDNTRQLFICRNSWGTSWGDKGYFYMPFAYLLDPNLSSDFWTIRLV